MSVQEKPKYFPPLIITNSKKLIELTHKSQTSYIDIFIAKQFQTSELKLDLNKTQQKIMNRVWSNEADNVWDTYQST